MQGIDLRLERIALILEVFIYLFGNEHVMRIESRFSSNLQKPIDWREFFELF